jgi:hypothetical protein
VCVCVGGGGRRGQGEDESLYGAEWVEGGEEDSLSGARLPSSAAWLMSLLCARWRRLVTGRLGLPHVQAQQWGGARLQGACHHGL